jgi:hypothetical protein
LQKHNIACPDCLVAGVEAPLCSDIASGRFGYFCVSGHVFKDSIELMSRKAPKLSRPPASLPPTPQAGLVEIRIALPGVVDTALTQRFGIKKNPTIVAVLQTLCDPQAMLVSATDRAQIVEKLGDEFKTANELAGLIFSLKQDNRTLTETKEDLEKQMAALRQGKVAESGGSGGVFVVLETDALERLKQIADFREMDLGKMLTETITGGVDAGWF